MEFLIGFLLGIAAGSPSEPSKSVAPEIDLGVALAVAFFGLALLVALLRFAKRGL
jgi:hypothetical protein